jgi:hypothetical protein
MSVAPVTKRPSRAIPPAKKASIGVSRRGSPAAKVATKSTAKPAASAAMTAAALVPEAKRVKLVRDSFTMPRADFDLVDVLKQRALGFRRPTKKSELLRAGLQTLNALNAGALQRALDGLVPLKAGRPKKPT